MSDKQRKMLEASIDVLVELKAEIERRKKLEKVKRLVRQIPKPYVIFNAEPCDAEANILKDLYWTDDDNDFLRLNPWHVSDFEKLFELVSEYSPNVVTNWRQLTPRHKLAITIRYLATGEAFIAMESVTKVSRSAMSQFVPKMLPLIYEALEKYYKMPTMKKEWQQIAKDFESRWHFPHVVGALLGKRIRLKSSNQRPLYLILYAIVDAHSRFITFDICTNKGDINYDDNAALANCIFYRRLHNELLNLPDHTPLFDGSDELYPYFFISDTKFTLENHVLKPYDHVHNDVELNELERIFNFRLRYANKVIEYAMQKFVKRFGIFKRPLEMHTETSESVLRTACALHNYLTKKRQEPGICEINLEDSLPESFSDVQTRLDQISSESEHIRDQLSYYFTVEGNVNFQWEKIQYTYKVFN